ERAGVVSALGRRTSHEDKRGRQAQNEGDATHQWVSWKTPDTTGPDRPDAPAKEVFPRRRVGLVGFIRRLLTGMTRRPFRTWFVGRLRRRFVLGPDPFRRRRLGNLAFLPCRTPLPSGGLGTGSRFRRRGPFFVVEQFQGTGPDLAAGKAQLFQPAED